MSICEIIISFVVSAMASLAVAWMISRSEVFRRFKQLSGNLPTWELLLSHSEDGTILSGSHERLRDAVEKAYPIKIVYGDNNIDVMEAEWIFMRDGLIHASNTSQVSLHADANGDFYFPDDSYHYYQVMNTRGIVRVRRYNMDGGLRDRAADQNDAHIGEDRRERMKWFALVPPSVL